MPRTVPRAPLATVRPMNAIADDVRRHASTFAWWGATVLTLVVLDDLTFGPAFWALSRLAGPVVAVVTIYLVYVPGQIYLVARGTRPEPGRVAAFFLSRLELERRSSKVAVVEKEMRDKVVGSASAVAMSLLVAGVLPPLILWRRGFARADVLRISVVTATVYATEFA